MLKTLKDLKLSGKKVIVRAEFNVPIIDGKVDENEDWRIKKTLPTIKYLLERKAKTILIAHLGRPKGNVVESLRLNPVANRLGELLSRRINKLDESVGEKVRDEINKMNTSEIIMLENIRFYKGEEENDDGFAKELASYGDVYIDEAFGAMHRNHASIVGIPRFIKQSAAGLLVENEIKVLEKIIQGPERPFSVIIGGVKISTKLKLIDKFIKKADNLVLGGALANTVLKAHGLTVGRSTIEESMVEKVKHFQLTNTKLHIPIDVVTSADSTGNLPIHITGAGNVSKDELILDIGPDTAEIFSNVMKESKTFIWNGPMGLIEVKKFAKSTEIMANAAASSAGFSIVGGGETVGVLSRLGILNKIDHVSTGGGSMLDFLANETLVGLEALER